MSLLVYVYTVTLQWFRRESPSNIGPVSNIINDKNNKNVTAKQFRKGSASNETTKYRGMDFKFRNIV